MWHIKSLDKYACHRNEVVLIYFKIALGEKRTPLGALEKLSFGLSVVEGIRT